MRRVMASVLVAGGLPAVAVAKRSKLPPAPDAWTYTVSGTRTVSTRAKGEGAEGMPAELATPTTTTLDWTARAGVDHINPDGSLSELLRITAPGTPLDGRAFGLRRFEDGEVLRVERFLELADTGLDGWDPVLLGLSPARPEKVTAKTPGRRALQWTARVGTAQFLRSNCPATWTLVEDAEEPVAGWLGRPVEHVRYDAKCTLNGRADIEGGGPVPIRGQGVLTGEIWWDVDTHQILRHELSLTRTVESRWVATTGRVSIEQEQAFQLTVDWTPADAKPDPVRALPTEALVAVLPDVVGAWGQCAQAPGEREVVLVAGHAGALEVRAVRAPTGPSLAVPSAAAVPGFMAPPPGPDSAESDTSLDCWQRVADGARLPEHDEDGVEFTFVMPRKGDAYGMPGVMDRTRPAPGALFVVVPEALVDGTEAWLGVR